MRLSYCSLTVSSLDKSVRFYSALFNSEPAKTASPRAVHFPVGGSYLALRLAPEGHPISPVQIGIELEEPLESLVARLASRLEPDRPKPVRDRSFLSPLLPELSVSRRFRDPDGHLLELFNGHGRL